MKRWHPDRFVSDPVGQADASTRLREINGAFRLIAEDLAGTGVRAAPGHDASRAWSRPQRAPGRPLTREEIEAMVGVLGSDGPVDTLLKWFSVLWPFAIAVALLVQPRTERPVELVANVVAGAFILLGLVPLVPLVRKRLLSRRRWTPE